jgi:hypothetical protein
LGEVPSKRSTVESPDGPAESLSEPLDPPLRYLGVTIDSNLAQLFWCRDLATPARSEHLLSGRGMRRTQGIDGSDQGFDYAGRACEEKAISNYRSFAMTFRRLVAAEFLAGASLNGGNFASIGRTHGSLRWVRISPSSVKRPFVLPGLKASADGRHSDKRTADDELLYLSGTVRHR